MYQKWPDQIFPIANFVFSRDGHFGLGGGEGVLGEGSPPLWVLIILKKPWVGGYMWTPAHLPPTPSYNHSILTSWDAVRDTERDALCCFSRTTNQATSLIAQTKHCSCPLRSGGPQKQEQAFDCASQSLRLQATIFWSRKWSEVLIQSTFALPLPQRTARQRCSGHQRAAAYFGEEPSTTQNMNRSAI